jgi:hypothetical protein
MPPKKKTEQDNTMGNGETNNGSKLTTERILLMIALGGNISLGGILGFSGGEKDEPIPLAESCEFQLEMCKIRLDLSNGSIMRSDTNEDNSRNIGVAGK